MSKEWFDTFNEKQTEERDSNSRGFWYSYRIILIILVILCLLTWLQVNNEKKNNVDAMPLYFWMREHLYNRSLPSQLHVLPH